MKIDKYKIKKILLITLSNIGDVVLTLPVLGVLKREYPSADITVVVGPNGKEFFEADTSISQIIVYDKHMPLLKKVNLGLWMRRLGFDLAVDLRNSLFPFLVGARYSSPFFVKVAAGTHRKDKHLAKLFGLGISVDGAAFAVSYSRDDKLRMQSLLNKVGVLPEDRMIAIAAGTKSHIKRWHINGFVELCEKLVRELGFKILLIGDESDKMINKEILKAAPDNVYDLSGYTGLRELMYLLSLCRLIITNDSAPLHMASAVNLPTVAIFGPTDYKKYGPLSENSIVIRKSLACSPCEKALCKSDLECMKQITADEVFEAAKRILSAQS